MNISGETRIPGPACYTGSKGWKWWVALAGFASQRIDLNSKEDRSLPKIKQTGHALTLCFYLWKQTWHNNPLHGTQQWLKVSCETFSQTPTQTKVPVVLSCWPPTPVFSRQVKTWQYNIFERLFLRMYANDLLWHLSLMYGWWGGLKVLPGLRLLKEPLHYILHTKRTRCTQS